MMTPRWPDWGGDRDKTYPWHTYKGPQGDLHAGYLLATVIGPEVTSGQPIPYEIVRCESCISIHAWPLPSPDALAQYYATQFYQHEKPDYLVRYARDYEWWETCVHRPLLQQAWSLLPQGRRREIPRMMEIGAGPGIALDVALEMGFRTYALEPSPACAERLKEKGHRCFELTLEQVPQQEGQWGEAIDIVYLYEVLEHQPCPEDFLLRCYELLAPGGVIVIAVPNDCSPIQYEVCEHLQREPYWFAPPQHLHYFSPKMLQLVVRRCGMTIRDIRGTYPMERYILEGNNYLGDDVRGRMVHHQRMAQELQAYGAGDGARLEAQYRANMAEARAGREMYLLAQKEGG